LARYTLLLLFLTLPVFLTSRTPAVQAQTADLLITPAPDPTLEALLRPTVEAIVANLTITAVAFAVAPEDVPGIAAAGFLIAMASMLLAAGLLGYWLFIYQNRNR